MSPSARSCFAYYCSGHGYGHATRVSAFASHLLTLPEPPIVHIVSSAPAHVFSDSIALGAQYRNADIDPVIVQPLAYRVDRERSVDALKAFLAQKERKLEEEAEWLANVGADCVLSDAAFLAFLAAHKARIPSILITNFTFDSVFSYLASNTDQSGSLRHTLNAIHHDYFTPHAQAPDPPIPQEDLDPLVQQIYEGYRHADLLLRLPGAIPIPSFIKEPSLPAPAWIDSATGTFSSSITSQIYQATSTYTLLPPIPFSDPPPASLPKPFDRAVHDAPMLVRLPSKDIYTPQGRSRLLSSLSIPSHLHDPTKTKILVVSFGGQVFHKPSRSRTPSRPSSMYGSPHGSDLRFVSPSGPPDAPTGNGFSGELAQSLSALAKSGTAPSATKRKQRSPPPVFSPSHIYIPGAPAPALRSPLTPSAATLPTFNTIPPSPDVSLTMSASQASLDSDAGQILPDDSWIAIVCGVADSKEWRSRAQTPKESTSTETNENGTVPKDDELPEGFYIAPKTVYMPDLMAVGDVLLGKLGYGTVSECVDSCTPFVFVSRPLFVEEHGLRLYLSREGVGIEMEHEEYEAGNWAAKVSEAWAMGAQRKRARRVGVNAVDRRKEGKEMANFVVGWVRDWYEKVGQSRSV